MLGKLLIGGAVVFLGYVIYKRVTEANASTDTPTDDTSLMFKAFNPGRRMFQGTGLGAARVQIL